MRHVALEGLDHERAPARGLPEIARDVPEQAQRAASLATSPASSKARRAVSASALRLVEPAPMYRSDSARQSAASAACTPCRRPCEHLEVAQRGRRVAAAPPGRRG